jgi:cell division initiation protein
MSKTEETANTSELSAGSQTRRLPGVERQLGVSPLDMRQAKFGTAMRGFERSEVTSFLIEAADGYEQALRENDRLRQEISRLESSLQQFRELENGLRTMLVSAQKVADDMRENAQQEAARIVREAEGRAELATETARAQVEDVQRDIDGLKLKRRDAENNLESMVASLQSTLEFVRAQEARDREHKVVAHRPRLESVTAATA